MIKKNHEITLKRHSRPIYTPKIF